MRSFLVVKCNHEDAVHHRDAEEGDETDGGGDAEVQTGNVECQDAPNHCDGDSGERQKAVAHIVKQAIKQPRNQKRLIGTIISRRCLAS